MKKMISLVVVSILAVGSLAMAGSRKAASQVTDAQVQAVIDARLHEMLKDLNARHAQ